VAGVDGRIGHMEEQRRLANAPWAHQGHVLQVAQQAQHLADLALAVEEVVALMDGTAVEEGVLHQLSSVSSHRRRIGAMGQVQYSGIGAGSQGFSEASTPTQDADSEGEEAKFFVWTPDEIRAVLGDRADRFIEVYGGSGSRKPHYLGECYSLTVEHVHLTTEWLEIKILVLGSTNIIY
jgi:hypothetical protein